MFHSFPLLVLVLIFVAAAVAVWIAGIQLSNTTDVMSSRFGLGQALGGLILLAIATNLPEIAITASAALSNNVGIAIATFSVALVYRRLSLSFWTSSAYGDGML